VGSSQIVGLAFAEAVVMIMMMTTAQAMTASFAVRPMIVRFLVSRSIDPPAVVHEDDDERSTGLSRPLSLSLRSMGHSPVLAGTH
jgi:hypothetical protein